MSQQGFSTGIHYELTTSDKDYKFTGRKEFCCYRILSVLMPKVTQVDDYESFMEAHQIRLKRMNDCYGLELEDRNMNFEINNVDLVNDGLNKAYQVLDELLKDVSFDRVFVSILEVLRFMFSLMLCLTYNLECLSSSHSQVNQEHARGIRSLNIFDSQAKKLLERLTNCPWADSDRPIWLRLLWFVNNVLKALKNPKVFPGFLKHLIDLEFNKFTSSWTASDNVVQLKNHPEIGQVEFLEPFTDETLNSISNSYLISVDQELRKRHP
ncbi:hypothetical protein Ciccas_013185 [Cichlidogyrus casuarinus]|uniref:Uncharacterized protein n=1 Tax=Cichlidogyrus casuarinus TaxID=1844966 RepID=A0ABD2PL81_9PLAT